MMDICKDRYQAFGAAGQGSKIKAISLEKMVKLYESGKLTPNIK
jgi:fructose-bisphosphate aldolase class II